MFQVYTLYQISEQDDLIQAASLIRSVENTDAKLHAQPTATCMYAGENLPCFRKDVFNHIPICTIPCGLLAYN